MKFNIIGEENVGWSVDKDARALRQILSTIYHNCFEVNLGKADLVFVVMWSSLRGLSMFKKALLKRKRVIVFASNDVFHNPDLVRICLQINAELLVSSKKQKNYIDMLGLKCEVFQYQIDSKLLADQKSNSFSYLRDEGKKLLVGSFQRDSLGVNLNKPKWEKNPDYLIQFAEANPLCKLVLCGPRRHYLVKKLREKKINYIYVGDENYINRDIDDIEVNNIPPEVLRQLYDVIDFYLVTSLSESGPKAILECIALEKPVFSTRVGLAIDFLPEKFLYDDVSNLNYKRFSEFSEISSSLIYTFQQQLDFYSNILKC